MEKIIRTRIGTSNIDELRAIVDRINKKGGFAKIESQVADAGKRPVANIPISGDAKRFGEDLSEFTVAIECKEMYELLMQAGNVAARCAEPRPLT